MLRVLLFFFLFGCGFENQLIKDGSEKNDPDCTSVMIYGLAVSVRVQNIADEMLLEPDLSEEVFNKIEVIAKDGDFSEIMQGRFPPAKGSEAFQFRGAAERPGEYEITFFYEGMEKGSHAVEVTKGSCHVKTAYANFEI